MKIEKQKEGVCMISYNAIRKNKTLSQVIGASDAELEQADKKAAAAVEKDKKE